MEAFSIWNSNGSQQPAFSGRVMRGIRMSVTVWNFKLHFYCVHYARPPECTTLPLLVALQIFCTFSCRSNAKRSIFERVYFRFQIEHLLLSTSLFIRATRNRRHSIDVDRIRYNHLGFVRFLHNLAKYCFRHAIIKLSFTAFTWCAIVRLIFICRFFTPAEWWPL